MARTQVGQVAAGHVGAAHVAAAVAAAVATAAGDDEVTRGSVTARRHRGTGHRLAQTCNCHARWAEL